MSEIVFLGSNLRRETAAGNDFGEATLLTNQNVLYQDMIDQDGCEDRRVRDANAQKEFYDFIREIKRM